MNRRQILKELRALVREWEWEAETNKALSTQVSEFSRPFYNGKAKEGLKHAEDIRKLLRIARNY